ncbi:MAG: hypothetical protein WC429_15965 [Verrucomicrobiia bacterium]|jgi:hypothetical protein
MRLARFILTALLLVPLAALAEEATIRGEPIIKDDFERCTPKDKILNDEKRRGFWDLRFKTWGDKICSMATPMRRTSPSTQR